jgi:hypothetical protein
MLRQRFPTHPAEISHGCQHQQDQQKNPNRYRHIVPHIVTKNAAIKKADIRKIGGGIFILSVNRWTKNLPA